MLSAAEIVTHEILHYTYGYQHWRQTSQSSQYFYKKIFLVTERDVTNAISTLSIDERFISLKMFKYVTTAHEPCKNSRNIVYQRFNIMLAIAVDSWTQVKV